MTVKVSVIGATGYAGIELVRLLSGHPEVELTVLTSRSYVGQKISRVYPHLTKQVNLVCEEQNLPEVIKKSEVVFVALPHGMSASVIRETARQGKKVVDIGADFRLRDSVVYEQWYGKHEAPEFLSEAVYGLPEKYREQIRQAWLVANPGCYPTGALLALLPLYERGLALRGTIIVDSKSGVSGAGRTLDLGVHYSECNENVKAYKVGTHRHGPEIEQEISDSAGCQVPVLFTPHLIPMTRGILSTVYVELPEGMEDSALWDLYRDYYTDEPFVVLLEPGMVPETKWTFGSNYCYLGLVPDRRSKRLIIVSAIDNLVKGAAGQAVQNFNLMCGLPEKTGLEQPGIYP